MFILNLSVFIAFLMAGCSTVSKGQGLYIETTYGDSLFLNKDKTYYYVECLSDNKEGLTDGTWKQKGGSIHFKASDKPLVGYRKELAIDSIHQGRITLVNKQTGEAIPIQRVQLFSNGKTLRRNSFKKIENTIFFKKDFDSIIIETKYYKPLKLAQHIATTSAYTISLLPVERPYILDKIPFQYLHGRLQMENTSKLPAVLSFSKLQ